MDGFFILTPEQGMKLRILQGINKPIKQLSVTEICLNANVSRKTFYHHFDTKYDPAFWYTGLGEKIYLDAIGRTLSWKEGISCLLTWRRKMSDAILFSSENNLFDGDNTRRFNRRKKVICKTIELASNVRIDDRIDFIISSYIGVEMVAFNYFLNHYTEVSVEKLADRFLEIVPPIMFDLMPPKEAKKIHHVKPH